MKLELNSGGILQFSGAWGKNVKFYSGDRFIGEQDGTRNQFPLHAAYLHRDAISRYGLTAFAEGSNAPVAVDISALVLNFLDSGNLAAQMSAATGPGKWSIYTLMFTGEKIATVTGGVVVPEQFAGTPFKIRCGKSFAHETHLYPDPVMEPSHWFMPAGCVLGFTASIKLEDIPDFLVFDIDFDVSVPAPVRRQYRPHATFTKVALPPELPDEVRIRRVSGSLSTQRTFLNGGYTAWIRIREIAKIHGVDADAPDTKLFDWGVGCGRVARYFSALKPQSIAGADIDDDNIRWCQANLPGDWRTVGLFPPTSWEANSFDLVYSCSVLSHLTEDAANSWLEELKRIMKPGALALLSHNSSSNTVSYLSLRPHALRQTLQTGFFDADINRDLIGFVPSDDYYRATYATNEWWDRMFTRHFEVVAIEYAAVSGFQEIAVLRKRP